MAARLWNKAPFVRLLLALATGVVVQWHWPVPLNVLAIGWGASLLLFLLFSLLPVGWRFKLSMAGGIALLVVMAGAGCMMVACRDVRNHPQWFGQHYTTEDLLLVTVEEPLVEKPASYKAIASVRARINGGVEKPAAGKVVLYFKKDTVTPTLHYGSQLLLSKHLLPIKNAGNPGSFDYRTYSLFQGITHQGSLATADYFILPQARQNGFKKFLFSSRAWVVSTLKKYISGGKEQGLAEALLIGYKDDLDKNLVQAYSNTGVVHIIAISGLHLGLIYALLLLVTKPLAKIKRLQWLRLLLIVSALWLFSLLAGGGPSVLRSALMFSLMAIGSVALRKTNIINTLAFSAFVLLCINPFWLWDVGFQLSYMAVLSIVLFFRPVYALFGFHNKAIDFLWKLTAVTLSAQVLTLPVSIYHFHQMPLLFLLTNFVAVPLSSIILTGEILLCFLSFFPPAAGIAGVLLKHLIRFMNNYIEGLDRLPFSSLHFLSITLAQAFLLLVFAMAFSYWLMEKNRRYGWMAWSVLAAFMCLRGLSFASAYRQRQLIVYNVPRHPAIDIINGRQYAFAGDTVLLHDGFERNFHLQPSRILHRAFPFNEAFAARQFRLGQKRVLLLDTPLQPAPTPAPQPVDLLILSRNPKLSLPQLLQTLVVRQVVIDASVPPWKAARWKRDCDSLHIGCHNVSEDGAFVMNW